jgi:NAD(P)-dependent dehydrogenase (short-subunit alcohol dehydrogenase family)
MFTYELLARRLGDGGVTANALHPGVVRTGFGAEDPAGIQRLIMPLAPLFMKSPEQGAVTSINLASASGLERVSGRYFANSKPRRSSKRSYDEAVAARLWQVSADLDGLDGLDAPRTSPKRRPTSRLRSSESVRDRVHLGRPDGHGHCGA